MLLSGSKGEKIYTGFSPPLPRSKLSAAGWPRRQKVQRLRSGEGAGWGRGKRERRKAVRAGIAAAEGEKGRKGETNGNEGAARQDAAQFIVSEREREREREEDRERGRSIFLITPRVQPGKGWVRVLSRFFLPCLFSSG